MEKILLIGGDVHKDSMVTRYALDRGAVSAKTFAIRKKVWSELAAHFKGEAERQGAARSVFAYEASGLRTGRHDFLRGEGLGCHVLAPTKIKRSQRDLKRKNDAAGAELLLETLRGHDLAGNALPAAPRPDAASKRALAA